MILADPQLQIIGSDGLVVLFLLQIAGGRNMSCISGVKKDQSRI